jgi:integrase
MQAEPAAQRWEKTRLQNLVRHKASGRYYARLYLNGKEIWKSLKTSHFSVAQARLAALRKEHREHRGKEIDSSSARMTFGQAAALHMRRVNADVSLKRRTQAYWREIDAALLKSWPGLAETEIRKITPAACREWAAKYAKMVSATRFNGTLSFFRHVIEAAIENGVLYSSPALGLSRMTVRAKRLELPTRAQFAAFIAEMRAGHGRDSMNCADLAQGLAFTGCRISEAAQIAWSDLDFTGGEILVRGDPEEATKNGEIRRVPMIPGARELFERMQSQRAGEAVTDKVFLVRECQKAMNRAAKKTGMTRITHHDLRHFFAIVSIESGVDIPTVSRWLGHKDGGALAMRTYGHLRREHNVAQAQKVSHGSGQGKAHPCGHPGSRRRPVGPLLCQQSVLW